MFLVFAIESAGESRQMLLLAVSCVIISSTNIDLLKSERSVVKTQPARGGICHVHKLMKTQANGEFL